MKGKREGAASAGRVREAFLRAYKSVQAKARSDHFRQQLPPPFQIQYYPYVGLRSTVRVREGRIILRLSDLLKEAPLQVIEALIAILLHRLDGTEAPPPVRNIYRDFTGKASLRQAVLEARRRRGRKKLNSPSGKVFDLRLIFQTLNRRYFKGKLRVRHLSWSSRSSRRTLGHYDPAHEAIVINRRLDQPMVPHYVVEFVVYHEMLHAALGEQSCYGRRRLHHADFRRAERDFHDYQRARAFIRDELG